jgi:hypothetical protein
VKSSKKKVPYPFYTLEDVNYSKFIIRLLSYMYTRQFEPGELIAREMIESGEIIFVEKGIYNIGYEINKKEFLRRQFGPSTNIGGYQVSTNSRF